jgi:hypothetical protein
MGSMSTTTLLSVDPGSSEVEERSLGMWKKSKKIRRGLSVKFL